MKNEHTMIQNLFDTGQDEMACALIDAGAEREREQAFDEYCDQMETEFFLEWLEVPFNQIKLKQKFAETENAGKPGENLYFDMFCEGEFNENREKYVNPS